MEFYIDRIKQETDDFLNMVVAVAKIRGFDIDEKNPIREIKQKNGEWVVILNEKPREISVTFRAAPGDFDFLENLY